MRVALNKQSVHRIIYAIQPLFVALGIVMGLVVAVHFWPIPVLTMLGLVGITFGLISPPAFIILLLIWKIAVRLHRYDQEHPPYNSEEQQTAGDRLYLRDLANGKVYVLTPTNGELPLTPFTADNSDPRELLQQATEGAPGNCPVGKSEEPVLFGGKTQ